MLRDEVQMIDQAHGLLKARMQHGARVESWVELRQAIEQALVGRRGSRRVFRLTDVRCDWLRMSGGCSDPRQVSVSPPVRKSSTRDIHRDSRSKRCPACSCADHLSSVLAISTSREMPLVISSRRAGVPRKRTQRLGYCSSGKVKANFRSNQTGTWLMGSGLDFGRWRIASILVG